MARAVALPFPIHEAANFPGRMCSYLKICNALVQEDSHFTHGAAVHIRECIIQSFWKICCRFMCNFSGLRFLPSKLLGIIKVKAVALMCFPLLPCTQLSPPRPGGRGAVGVGEERSCLVARIIPGRRLPQIGHGRKMSIREHFILFC